MSTTRPSRMEPSEASSANGFRSPRTLFARSRE
jgi:hypothetical protein